jgi:hypothetical protein
MLNDKGRRPISRRAEIAMMCVPPHSDHTGSPLRTVGILQPGYLPWLGFFEQLYRSHIFVLYDDVQFEKGSWRNRNRIKTPQGPQWLTVPVVLKGKGFCLIKDVTINSGEPWARKHMKSLRQNYGKAPFFEHYADPLFHILQKGWKYLVDLDVELIHWLKEVLRISTPVVLSSDLAVPGRGSQRLVDIVLSLEGNHFYEGQAGKNYIEDALFERSGIQVTYQEYRHPRYPQVFGDFISCPCLPEKVREGYEERTHNRGGRIHRVRLHALPFQEVPRLQDCGGGLPHLCRRPGKPTGADLERE